LKYLIKETVFKYVGGNSGTVWCDISSVCIGPRVLHNKGWLVFCLLIFSLSYFCLCFN